MKITLQKCLFLVLVISIKIQLNAQGRPNYVPSNGLVGWWPFNGNAIDSSGTGNNGSVTGASLTSDRFGRSNQAYSFDGNADYINCGNASSLSISGSITISVWIYANNFNTDHGIVSKYNTSPSYELITSSPYSIAPLNKVRWLDAGGFLFSNAINANTWYHLVTVFDVTNQKKYIYINGNLVAQSSVSLSAIPTNSNNLYIGSHQPSNVSYWSWDGKLDDVGIWNRVLTDCEIKSLYLAQAHTIPTLNIGNDTIRSCKLDSVKLTANNGFVSYSWSNGASTKSTYIKTNGKIVIVATDSFGCKAKDSAIVSVLNPRILPRDTVVCKGAQVNIRGRVNNNAGSNSSCGYMLSGINTGLVSWYPFCGNANDGSGNANHGTVNGATLTNDRFGNTNSAYYFNGTSDYIQISLASMLNKIPANTSFTSSVWVKTADNHGPVISMQGTGGIEYDFHIGTLADIVQSPGNYGILVRDNCCGTGNNIFGSSVVNNNWHMLTIVRTSNGTIKLYKNGTLEATSSASQSGQLQFTTPYLNLGADRAWVVGSGQGCNSCNTNNQQHLNGVIDDVGFWNRELSSSEISQLYTIQNQSSTSLLWSNSGNTNSSTYSVNANTKVWLKATDGIGTCYDTTNVFVRSTTVDIGNDTIRSCKFDSLQLNASSGFVAYNWSTGATSQNAYIKSTGKVVLTATDSFGCIAKDSAIVSVLSPKIAPRDTVVCKGTQVTLRSSINSNANVNSICGYLPNAIKSGMVDWYPFCGNANDNGSLGNHGTVYGANLISDRFGNANSAYSFNGSSSYISLAQPFFNGSTSVSEFTFSIWFNMNQLPTSGGVSLFGKEGFWRTHQIYVQSNGAIGYAASQPSPQGYIGITSSANLISTNNWYNVVVTYSNSTLKLYLNNSLIQTSSISYSSLDFSYLTLGNSTATNFIGARNPATGIMEYVNGKIDDFGVWNRALTSSEVAQLYTLQSSSTKVTWSTSDTTSATNITANANTKVWLKATDGIGVCYDTTSIIVSKPDINLSDTSLFTACKRDSMLLNIGFKWKNIQWSNGDKDSSTYLAQTGKYFVQANDQFGCQAYDSTYFVNPGKPRVVSVVVDSVNCFAAKDGGIKCTYSGGFTPYQYQWNDVAKQSTPNALNLSKGTYKVVVSDFYNCKDSATAAVYEPLKLQVKLVSTDSVNCFGGSDGSIKVSVSGGSNGYAYYWNDPLKQKTATASGLSKGTYKVNVKDIYGCSDSLSADVLEPLKVKVLIQSFANAKCFGYTNGSALASANGGTGLLRYSWNTSPTQTSNVATNLAKGVYQVRAVDAYGCFDTASVNINEPPKIVPLISGNRLAVRDVSHELSATVTPAQAYTYSWTPSAVFGKNTNTAVKNGKFYTTTLVTLRTTDANGCFGEDTATITVLIPFADFIPTVFSPNADKHNDVFGLPDIFEIEQLDVYDRWGALLFKGSKDQPVWDGTYGGEYVPTGSYMYIIKAKLKGTIYEFEHQGTIGVIR